MLLRTKDNPQRPVNSFWNGNCELVIAEQPSINMISFTGLPGSPVYRDGLCIFKLMKRYRGKEGP